MTRIINAVCRAVSAVFSPLLVPTYGAMTAMWITPLREVPEGTRFATAGVIFLMTCVFPTAAILTRMKMGQASDLDLSNRHQRPAVYAFTLLCYVLTCLYMVKVKAPLWLLGFFIGGTGALATAMCVNYKWKISAHATAYGGLLGMLFYMAAAQLADVFFLPWLTGAVVCGGLLASARVRLGAHCLSQVVAGAANGLVWVLALMSLL